MVARWLPPYYVSLGTDGFGRSDTRENLRALFEIDPPHIAAATLVGLVRCGASNRTSQARRSASSASTPTRSTLSPSNGPFGAGSGGRCIVAALHRGPQP